MRYLDAVWLPEGVHAELASRAHHGTSLDWHDDLRQGSAAAIAGAHAFATGRRRCVPAST